MLVKYLPKLCLSLKVQYFKIEFLTILASFSIPCTETEPIEDVLFVEPDISRVNEAIELVKRYNEEGKPWIRKTYKTQKPESVISDSTNLPNPWLQNQGARLSL